MESYGNMKVLAVLAVWGALLCTSAFADDGQIDISSVPITITEPGSYVVVQNLTVTALDTHGIVIEASDVTLDLNGFTLTGPGKTAGSSGSGIFVDDSSFSRTTVRNGTVRDWRYNGVDVGSDSTVENVKAISNGSVGIAPGGRCTIRNCIASLNDNSGMQVGSQSVISGNVCYQNSGWGILANQGSVLVNNTCSENSTGIDCDRWSNIRGNICFNNNKGIVAENSLVCNNTAQNNYSGSFDLTSCTSVDNHAP